MYIAFIMTFMRLIRNMSHELIGWLSRERKSLQMTNVDENPYPFTSKFTLSNHKVHLSVSTFWFYVSSLASGRCDTIFMMINFQVWDILQLCSCFSFIFTLLLLCTWWYWGHQIIKQFACYSICARWDNCYTGSLHMGLFVKPILCCMLLIWSKYQLVNRNHLCSDLDLSIRRQSPSEWTVLLKKIKEHIDQNLVIRRGILI